MPHMKTLWLHRLTYLYLLIPFMLFCLGWLRLEVSLPIFLLIVWVIWRIWTPKTPSVEGFPVRGILVTAAIAGVWVFLSGIGGYAFQNWDHNWRNAVFHDLIKYPFPVIYSSPDKGAINMLVYYVGYWLPAVFAGKVFGWKAANFILFLWSWAGVLLTALHISLKMKTPAFRSLLFFIFFSGMDFIGVLFFAKGYPAILPPIQHIEIWAGSLQYSSFTTQLFWVFNQSIPAWLCFALILNSEKFDVKILGGALCFFFAPLAAIGLFPYLLLEGMDELRAGLKTFLKAIRFDVVAAGLAIVAISYLYFSSNTAAQERGLHPLPPVLFTAFFLLDGGLLLLLLAPKKWRDPRWAVAGILLLFIPFIQFGNGQDFVMRASIAPLFGLMLMTGETLDQNNQPRMLRVALFAVLLIGALSPVYEINRSLYRTTQYYLLDKSQRAVPVTEPALNFEKGGAPEYVHPNELAADYIYSFSRLKDKLVKNFIGDVRQSLYYRYLSPR